MLFFYVDDNGLGPLHHAIANNDAEMLKLLIGCGEFDLFERNDAGQSPLVYAARMAHPGIECISILVSAITTFRKHHHDDVLSDHFSNIGASRRQLIKSLPLHDEANVRYALTDAMGRNVIHYAALNNAPHLVHYFATCGANVNLVDNHGDAPIHLAARGGNVEAVAALILNNCDMSVRDASERTAYTVADLQGYSLVCELFNKAQNVSCN
ncbi:hypothetical protein KIN20_028118 [Parelaphostrongylus tenuis]|uniref:Uncharacterized protein n=1 Tax=Parelaphostrongylus tenuis TaxID=148309 RepID=A0AAD5R0Q5_PARTN|nr:hypothetical protein KIN20_028118 [Parelaphostrongylus tenuis]